MPSARRPQIQKDGLAVEFYGEKAKEYEQIFKESFLPIPRKTVSDKKGLPIAVLKYKAGLINSRKAMISPYLPKLVGSVRRIGCRIDRIFSSVS